jgi:hypothetical protein
MQTVPVTNWGKVLLITLFIFTCIYWLLGEVLRPSESFLETKAALLFMLVGIAIAPNHLTKVIRTDGSGGPRRAPGP